MFGMNTVYIQDNKNAGYSFIASDLYITQYKKGDTCIRQTPNVFPVPTLNY